MSIHTLGKKIKGWSDHPAKWAKEKRQLLITMGILAAVAIISFYLGYIARLETFSEETVSLKTPYSSAAYTPMSASQAKNTPMAPSSPQASSGAFVASKNGTKFYPANCSSAKRIKDANKVFFATAADAENEGYSRASGC